MGNWRVGVGVGAGSVSNQEPIFGWDNLVEP
jgi:hypothetical protein